MILLDTTSAQSFVDELLAALLRSSVPTFDKLFWQSQLKHAGDFVECGQNAAAQKIYEDLRNFLSTLDPTENTEKPCIDLNDDSFFAQAFADLESDFSDYLFEHRADFSPADIPFFKYRLAQLHTADDTNDNASSASRFESLRALRDQAWEKRVRRALRSAYPEEFKLAGYDGVDLAYRGLYNSFFNLNGALAKTHEHDAAWTEDLKELYSELQGLGKVFGI